MWFFIVSNSSNQSESDKDTNANARYNPKIHRCEATDASDVIALENLERSRANQLIM